MSAVVFYDDGRPGHRSVRGVVLDETDRYLAVLWEDRAEPNHIRKDDSAWMKNIRREEERP